METTPNGYVKLYRCLLENPIVCKDADHFAIWCYLLLKATHAERDMLFGGKRITLKPGQLITGRKKISTKLSISESKVQRILKSFESEHQIEQQMNSHNRLISILNWCLYQQSEQQIEQQVNSNRTTSEQQVNTNKNVKKDKNDKNVKKDIIPYPLDEFCFSSDMESKIKEWVSYKTQKKDTYTAIGFQKLMAIVKTNIAKYGELAVMNLVDDCMASNWKGIIWDKIKKEDKIENTSNNTRNEKEARGNENSDYDYDKFFS